MRQRQTEMGVFEMRQREREKEKIVRARSRTKEKVARREKEEKWDGKKKMNFISDGLHIQK